MLATPENDISGTMSFASLIDDVAIAMKQKRTEQSRTERSRAEQSRAQHRAFIVETLFKNGDCC
jgi:hypothetical protein